MIQISEKYRLLSFEPVVDLMLLVQRYELGLAL